MTTCPLVRPTRKRVSGSTSFTTPSISIISSLAKPCTPRFVLDPAAAIRRPRCVERLQRLQAACRHLAIVALLELEGQLLVLEQRAKARALDRGNMHEHVFRAVVGFDESEALGGVEEFNRTGTHGDSNKKW